MLDTHPESFELQPENAVLMQKWTGDPQDKGLIAIIPFLECPSPSMDGVDGRFGESEFPGL
jgi:NLI interacting factor-like phosphatase